MSPCSTSGTAPGEPWSSRRPRRGRLVAGQIAKIQGCRAVGVAGGDAKCRYVVDELGLDACVNYQTQDLDRVLKDACPGGIDVYFDNVGGSVLEAVLRRINRGLASRAGQRRRAAARPQPDAALDPAGADPGLRRLGSPGREADFLRDVSGWLKEGKSGTRRTSWRAWRTPRGPSWACSGARTLASSSSGWATTRRGRGGD